MTPDIITLDELPEYFAGISEDWNRMSYRPFLDDEIPLIAFLEATFFTNEAGPDEVKWRSLSPRTRKRVGIEGPDRILVDTGALKESLTSDSGSDGIRIVEETAEGWGLQFGTYVPYSVFNDDRPHVGLTEEYLDEATERCADFALLQMVDVAA